MQYFGTGRIGLTQNVAYTGTAGTITNVISPSVQKVRILCTTDAFVKIDNSPTATNADAYVVGLEPEYFTCTPGQKVSAVQVSAGGTLYVTEVG